MGFISYQNLNSLEEISFIAGSNFILEFNVYEEDGVTPQNLGGATISWALCPYGEFDYNVLEKTGTITGTNIFEVVLDAIDTLTLAGKYIQQPIITDFSGGVFRPSQGILLILPANATT